MALPGLLSGSMVWGQVTGSTPSPNRCPCWRAALVFGPDALFAGGGAEPVRALVMAARIWRH